jgi:hypothetical protein
MATDALGLCRVPLRRGLLAFAVVVRPDGVAAGDRGHTDSDGARAGCAAVRPNDCDCGCCLAAAKARPVQVRFLLVHWLGQSVIGSAVTGDRAERLRCHVLPTDDPVRALNILRAAAGLQPVSDEHDDQGG